MTQTMTIARWFFNKEMMEKVAPCEETKETVEFQIAKVEKETEKAICVWTIGYELDIVKVWIPKSVVKSEYTVEKKVERTTEEKFFEDVDEAQKFIDEKKAEKTFVSIKCGNNGITVFFKKI